MFSQNPLYSQYMDLFFNEHPSPSIAWIHYLDNGWFGDAAGTLLAQADKAPTLNAKHVRFSISPRETTALMAVYVQLMLSIGKLSHLTQAEPDGSVLDAFDDNLDFVSVHEVILDQFHAVLEKQRGRQSLDTQIDAILTMEASALGGVRPAFRALLRGMVHDLLQGKVLSTEDLIDVLTLKNNRETVEDYRTALQLLARIEVRVYLARPGLHLTNTFDQKIPEGRKLSAYRTIWRRIYIHDE
jgi:nuclear pore complex protein Nup133